MQDDVVAVTVNKFYLLTIRLAIELFPDKVGPMIQIGTNLFMLDLLILAILYKLILTLSSLTETI